MKLTRRQRRLQKQHEQEGQLEEVKKPPFSLKIIQPLTKAQLQTFEAFDDHHLLLHGMAGTGKTFISLYLSIDEVMQKNSSYKKIVLIRSVVPTRDMGFLPGNVKDKIKAYEAPYYEICSELFGRGDAYEILKQKNLIEFMSTSFIRGTTLNNAIVIVDEFSNANFHELCSIITRIGKNSKLIFCGDIQQSDLNNEYDKTGVKSFIKILQHMRSIHQVVFEIEDIVRSGLVKEFLIAKDDLKL